MGLRVTDIVPAPDRVYVRPEDGSYGTLEVYYVAFTDKFWVWEKHTHKHLARDTDSEDSRFFNTTTGEYLHPWDNHKVEEALRAHAFKHSQLIDTNLGS